MNTRSIRRGRDDGRSQSIAVQRNGRSSPLFSIQLVRGRRGKPRHPSARSTPSQRRCRQRVRAAQLPQHHRPDPAGHARCYRGLSRCRLHPAVLMPEKMDRAGIKSSFGNLRQRPPGPGYLAWLGSRASTQAQFQRFQLRGGRFGQRYRQRHHLSQSLRLRPRAASRPGASCIIYNRLIGIGIPAAPSRAATVTWHAQHAHRARLRRSRWLPLRRFLRVITARPGRLPLRQGRFLVIFDPSTFTSPNYASLSPRRTTAARPHQHQQLGPMSRARTTPTFGPTTARLVRDAQPTGSTFRNLTAGNQEISSSSAGNAGSGFQHHRLARHGQERDHRRRAPRTFSPFGGSDLCVTTDSPGQQRQRHRRVSQPRPVLRTRAGKPDIVAPVITCPAASFRVASLRHGHGRLVLHRQRSLRRVQLNYFPSSGQQFIPPPRYEPLVPGRCRSAPLIRQFFIKQQPDLPAPP